MFPRTISKNSYDCTKCNWQRNQGTINAQEGKIPDMIVGCLGGGSNFAGSIYEFLDEPSVKKIGVEAAETAALSNGTPGIMQGMYICCNLMMALNL